MCRCIACMHACMHACMCVKYIHTYLYLHIDQHTLIHACIHNSIDTRTKSYLHLPIHLPTHRPRHAGSQKLPETMHGYSDSPHVPVWSQRQDNFTACAFLVRDAELWIIDLCKQSPNSCCFCKHLLPAAGRVPTLGARPGRCVECGVSFCPTFLGEVVR